MNQRFAEALLLGATVGDTITYTAADVGTNLGDDFVVETWTPGGKTDPIVLELRYAGENTIYPTTIDKPIYFSG